MGEYRYWLLSFLLIACEALGGEPPISDSPPANSEKATKKEGVGRAPEDHEESSEKTSETRERKRDVYIYDGPAARSFGLSHCDALVRVACGCQKEHLRRTYCRQVHRAWSSWAQEANKSGAARQEMMQRCLSSLNELSNACNEEALKAQKEKEAAEAEAAAKAPPPENKWEAPRSVFRR
jgi:hypothetical protein